ncbi:universal stress protein [Hymenobacter lapidarius]|nr:universal stress protein [Hymenobacter lapidarius]
MKNILVPTDFSAESHHAYEVALQLAQHTGAA